MLNTSYDLTSSHSPQMRTMTPSWPRQSPLQSGDAIEDEKAVKTALTDFIAKAQ